MGFIRGGLLVVASIILFILFLIGNTFLTLSLSLQYDNVQPQFILIAEDLAEEQIGLLEGFGQEFEFMESYCENNTEFISNQEGYLFEIPCLEVSRGLDSVVEFGIISFVEKAYYQEYNCGFWDCFKETGVPFFLISEKAKDYWENNFWIVFWVSILLILVMLLLIENKFNLLTFVGGLLALSALLFNKLDGLFIRLTSSEYLEFIKIFFSEASTVFWLSLIIGVVILILGIATRLVKYGFTGHQKITQKEAKEMIKKEVKKNKEKEVEKTKTVKKKK